jgi:hypothetical protein
MEVSTSNGVYSKAKGNNSESSQSSENSNNFVKIMEGLVSNGKFFVLF